MKKKVFVVLDFKHGLKDLHDFFTSSFPDKKRRIVIGFENDDENLCGAILAIDKDNNGFIEYITTEEKYRKQGLAKELLQYIIKKTPYKNLSCHVRETNLASIKAFKSVGFKFIQFKTPYSNGDKKLEYGISTK